MTNTGRDFVTAALRELQVVSPSVTPSASQFADGLAAAADLLDNWRTKRLTVRGITIATYSLVADTQTYTIGDGGDFDQAYPEAIVRWGVIPDDTATTPVEIPMGRPLTASEWAAVRQKTQTGTRPNKLYFDRSYTAGLGNVLVHPVPDNNLVDVRLYSSLPQITAFAAATAYDLPPGYALAIKLQLALLLATRYGAAATVGADLKTRAAEALADIERANIVVHESPLRAEWAGLGHAAGGRVDLRSTDR